MILNTERSSAREEDRRRANEARRGRKTTEQTKQNKPTEIMHKQAKREIYLYGGRDAATKLTNKQREKKTKENYLTTRSEP
jgi:hypothetical protein